MDYVNPLVPMGKQKIPHWKSKVSSSRSRVSHGKGMEDNPVAGADSTEGLDHCDSVDVNCELGMVDGEICSIPYELYDLPDLREILSLDTWNECLTEEERYSLTANLPDMGQQSFLLTMRELLGGSNLYFGNPVDMFFERLKAGFYPPKVASLREMQLCLESRKHYHSLRSYHDRMAQMYEDMRRMWNQCDKDSSVEVKLNMWKTKRKRNDVNLLDLNLLPADGNFSSDEDELLCNFSKRVKSLGSSRANSALTSSSANGMNFISPNSSRKGVLKVKSSRNGLIYNQKKKVVLGEIVDQFRPKGLLKVVPRLPPSNQPDQTKLAARHPELLIGSQGLQDFKFSPLTPSTYSWETGALVEPPVLWQHNVGSSKAHTLLEQPQFILSQQGNLGSSRYYHSSDQNIYSEAEIPSLGKCKLFGHDLEVHNGAHESLVDMIGAKRRIFSSQSLGVLQHSRAMQDENTSIGSRILAGVSKFSEIGIGMKETSIGENVIHPENSERISDKRMLPLTYKRRKPQTDLNSSSIGNKLIKGSNPRSATPEDSNHHLGKNLNALKIKFMGWEESSSMNDP